METNYNSFDKVEMKYCFQPSDGWIERRTRRNASSQLIPNFRDYFDRFEDNLFINDVTLIEHGEVFISWIIWQAQQKQENAWCIVKFYVKSKHQENFFIIHWIIALIRTRKLHFRCWFHNIIKILLSIEDKNSVLHLGNDILHQQKRCRSTNLVQIWP